MRRNPSPPPNGRGGARANDARDLAQPGVSEFCRSLTRCAPTPTARPPPPTPASSPMRARGSKRPRRRSRRGSPRRRASSAWPSRRSPRSTTRCSRGPTPARTSTPGTAASSPGAPPAGPSTLCDADRRAIVIHRWSVLVPTIVGSRPSSVVEKSSTFVGGHPQTCRRSPLDVSSVVGRRGSSVVGHRRSWDVAAWGTTAGAQSKPHRQTPTHQTLGRSQPKTWPNRPRLGPMCCGESMDCVAPAAKIPGVWQSPHGLRRFRDCGDLEIRRLRIISDLPGADNAPNPRHRVEACGGASPTRASLGPPLMWTHQSPCITWRPG